MCSEAIHPGQFMVFQGSGFETRRYGRQKVFALINSKLQLVSILSVSTCTSPEEEGGTCKTKRMKVQREEKIKCFKMN